MENTILDAGSPEHAALEQLVGERLASDLAERRPLVMLGRVEQTTARDDVDAPGVTASNELLRGSVWSL